MVLSLSADDLESLLFVAGSCVLDKEHSNWAEIHPVTSITKIP
jgi:hypothetical protein